MATCCTCVAVPEVRQVMLLLLLLTFRYISDKGTPRILTLSKHAALRQLFFFTEPHELRVNQCCVQTSEWPGNETRHRP